MDRPAAIAALPHPYALAIRQQEAGATTDAIAHALGIDPTGVPMLLRLARDKLATLLDDPEASSPRVANAGTRTGRPG